LGEFGLRAELYQGLLNIFPREMTHPRPLSKAVLIILKFISFAIYRDTIKNKNRGFKGKWNS